ncbi:MAG: hypothetical protein R2909_12430 [Gemmatimonadales bacterium]
MARRLGPDHHAHRRSEPGAGRALPSGIQFSSSKPAELKLDYEETEGDLDGDGDHDDEDDAIETRLSIWRQEDPGDPFVKIGTVKTEGARELKAFLTSFSRYAISY